MTNPADLHAALLARLRTIESVTVFDGDVPAHPPADLDGRVFPYVVAWGSAGYTPGEARALDGDTGGALTWPAPLTVAAGDPGWCLEAAHLVRLALEGHALTATSGYLTEDEGAPSMRPDRDPDPPRFYVPMTFRCHA